MALYRTPVEAGHRNAVGGLWEEMGQLQFDFLVAEGLQPDHRLLDVGCGSLRAGVKLIPYLEPDRYAGVDQEQSLLAAGRAELGEELWAQRRPLLMAMDDFAVSRLGRTFDVAVAQSVWTHISLNLVRRCLYGVEQVLAPGGRFYATFFPNPDGGHHTQPVAQPAGFLTNYDRDPFHYDLDTLRWITDGTSLELENLGDWQHPRGQHMLRFTRRR